MTKHSSHQSVHPQPRVGVGVFVFREGRFLLGKRINSHGEGSWALPGGHLEFGETFQDTAVREVKEETGMNIANLRFAAITNDLFGNENKHYVTIWIASEWSGGEPTALEADRFVDHLWCDFDSLPTPLFSPWDELQSSPFWADIKKSAASASLSRGQAT